MKKIFLILGILLLVPAIISLNGCVKQESKKLLTNYSEILINDSKLGDWIYHPNYDRQCKRGSIGNSSWQICGDSFKLPLTCFYGADAGVYYSEHILCYFNEPKGRYEDEFISIFGDYGKGYGSRFNDFNSLIKGLGYDPDYLQMNMTKNNVTTCTNQPGSC